MFHRAFFNSIIDKQQRTAPQGAPRTPATCHNTGIDRQDFKFFFFLIFKLFSNFNEVQTYSVMMIC